MIIETGAPRFRVCAGFLLSTQREGALRQMHRLIGTVGILAATLLAATAVTAQEYKTVKSPNGRIEVGFRLDAQGAPRYVARLDGKEVLAESRMGVVREDADFSTGLQLVSESSVERVSDQYELLTGKRRLNTYLGHRKIFHLRTGADRKMQVIFQVSDDGLAFRYNFPEQSTEIHRVKAEVSSF